MNDVEDAAAALSQFERQWPFVLDRLKRDAQLLAEVNLPLIVGLRPDEADEPPRQPLTGDLMALDAIRRWNELSTPEAQALHTKRKVYRAARRLWDEEHPYGTRMTLKDCVAWATGAGIEIPWLDAVTTAWLINNPATTVASSPDSTPAHGKARNDAIQAKYKELGVTKSQSYVKHIQRSVPGAELLSESAIRKIVHGRT